MTDIEPMKSVDVFVVNRQPEVTYASRSIDDRRLEDRLTDYLAERGQVLVVSGPSKSGKSVLLRHRLPEEESVWTPGARVKSIDDVWERIISRLELWTERREGGQRSDTESEETSYEGGIRPGGIGGGGGKKQGKSEENIKIKELVQKYSRADAASRGLELARLPVVVDDFHLIPEPVQKELIGAFRSSIEKGVALVLAAVPHRAGDAVRTQTNMKGRVETLSIGLWNPQELRQIPELGFGPRGLNCSIETEQVDRLVENAFRSPMLMQKLCLELTKENSVVERKDELQPIRPPANWDEFFSRIARGLGEDAEIRALAEGRPTKGQPREIFQLENGDSVDIYPLLLRAVARTGPEMELSLSQIRTEVETLLGATVASDRCSATLGRMSDIAAERAGEGEDPALEFTESRLHILDPYFAFSLAWGEPPVSSLTPVE